MTAKKEPKKNLAALLEEEGAAAEASPDAPITSATTVTRGHGRSKTLQIRLNPEELEELERVAASRGLPTSTVAREAILRSIRPAQLRSADARRLLDAFARYVDSLAVPSPSGERYGGQYGLAPLLIPASTGELAMMRPAPGAVDVAFPEGTAMSFLMRGDDRLVQTTGATAAALLPTLTAFIQSAQSLRDQLAHGREPSETADAPTP
jgi:hypothetical protein